MKTSTTHWSGSDRIALNTHREIKVGIEAIGVDRIGEYARVPNVVRVESILDINLEKGVSFDVAQDRKRGGWVLEEKTVAGYWKNYDNCGEGGASNWPGRFDLSHWQLWMARDGAENVGAAAVAWRTAGLPLLEGREDVAELWDLRVAEASRGRERFPADARAMLLERAAFRRRQT